jgi:hypothetical protein
MYTKQNYKKKIHKHQIICFLKLLDEHNKHKKEMMEKAYLDKASMKDLLCKCNVLKCKCDASK